jgi:hypothetical protein
MLMIPPQVSFHLGGADLLDQIASITGGLDAITLEDALSAAR